jgi:hypothetical protein
MLSCIRPHCNAHSRSETASILRAAPVCTAIWIAAARLPTRSRTCFRCALRANAGARAAQLNCLPPRTGVVMCAWVYWHPPWPAPAFVFIAASNRLRPGDCDPARPPPPHSTPSSGPRPPIGNVQLGHRGGAGPGQVRHMECHRARGPVPHAVSAPPLAACCPAATLLSPCRPSCSIAGLAAPLCRPGRAPDQMQCGWAGPQRPEHAGRRIHARGQACLRPRSRFVNVPWAAFAPPLPNLEPAAPCARETLPPPRIGNDNFFDVLDDMGKGPAAKADWARLQVWPQGQAPKRRTREIPHARGLSTHQGCCLALTPRRRGRRPAPARRRSCGRWPRPPP